MNIIIIFSKSLCHANLCFMLATEHLWWYTYDCITAGDPLSTRVPTFRSVLPLYCSTAYHSLVWPDPIFAQGHYRFHYKCPAPIWYGIAFAAPGF